MEGRVDDSGWGWKMPGSARWWSLHNTRTDEREAEQLQSIFMSRGRGRGGRVWGLPRVPEWRYTSTPCVRHIQIKTKHTFSATFGAGDNVPLCCYGNTGFVVFSLPLTWADVSKYILVKCVQPLKLRARSNLLEAPFAMSSLRTIRLLQTQQKINKHTYTHSWAHQAHKSPGICNCTFRWLDDLYKLLQRGDALQYLQSDWVQ